jgi:hypothetical protein
MSENIGDVPFDMHRDSITALPVRGTQTGAWLRPGARTREVRRIPLAMNCVYLSNQMPSTKGELSRS